MYICFAISHIATQQVFTCNGLSWKDYDKETAEEILEEILLMNQDKHGHADARTSHAKLPGLNTYYYVDDHGLTISHTTEDKETLQKYTDLKTKHATRSYRNIAGLVVHCPNARILH